MSTPTGPLGSYPPSGAFGAGFTSPFDIAAATAALDRAVASLHPGEHGALTVQVTKDAGFGGGLVLRGPFNTEALATLTRSTAGRWGWTTGLRVAFVAMLPHDPGRMALTLEAAPPEDRPRALPKTMAAPDLGELYAVFRLHGNGKLAAAVKAVRAITGVEVRLRG